MKRIIRIILVTFILIVGLTAIHNTKNHKLKTENTKIKAESSVTHTEPPVIEEPPQEVIGTASVNNVQATGYITATGDCMLAYNYDWNADIAYKICMKESGGRANAVNPTDNHYSWAGCYGSYGLMQINCSHGQVFDPVKNMDIAYSMYKGWGNSFRAWTTCKWVSGCY